MIKKTHMLSLFFVYVSDIFEEIKEKFHKSH